MFTTLPIRGEGPCLADSTNFPYVYQRDDGRWVAPFRYLVLNEGSGRLVMSEKVAHFVCECPKCCPEYYEDEGD